MKPKSNRASPQGLKPFTYARSNGTAEEAAEKRHLPCVLKGRTFRCAVSFLLVIPSGLQPTRNLLFGLFQQPLKPCPFKTYL